LLLQVKADLEEMMDRVVKVVDVMLVEKVVEVEVVDQVDLDLALEI